MTSEKSMCPCGHIFTERDIGIDGEGPEDRVIFQCPDCHGITEMNRGGCGVMIDEMLSR